LLEVFVDAPLAVCEARDVKGMYALARKGALPLFTGVGAPYEAPEAPALRIESARERPAESAQRVLELLVARGTLALAVQR
jgi:bifunctional enzyme CysN/CysC